MVFPLLGLIGAGIGLGVREARSQGRASDLARLLRENTDDEGQVNQLGLAQGLLDAGRGKLGKSFLDSALGRQQTSAQRRAEQRGIDATELANEVTLGNVSRAETAEGRQQEQFQMTRQSHELQQKRDRFALEQAEKSALFTEQTRQLRGQLFDPANRQALMEGQDARPGAFQVGATRATGKAPEAGMEYRMTHQGLTQLPAPGSKRWTDQKANRGWIRSFGQNVGEFNRLIAQHGGEALGSVAKGRMESLRTQMLLQVKNLEDLGALQAPDIEVINGLLPQGTGASSLLDWSRSGKQAALIAYISQKQTESDQLTSDWRGFQPFSRELQMESRAQERGLTPGRGVAQTGPTPNTPSFNAPADIEVGF